MIIAYIIFDLLLVFAIVISYSICKKITNPITVINVIFLTWLTLGRTGYLGQYIPTYDSSIFVQINVLITDIGIIIGYGIKNKKIKLFDFKINVDKIFSVMRRISLVMSLVIFANLLINILTGRLLITEVRNISYSVAFGTTEYAQIYFNSAVYYIYQYLVRGFAFFDLSYSITKLLVKMEKISIVSIINYVLFIIIMQSRIEFMKMILFLVIITIYFGLKLNDYQKKILKKVFVLVSIATIIIFSFRSIQSDKGMIQHSIDSFIIDFSGSNYMFSTFFDQYNAGVKLTDSPIILKYLGGFGLIIEFVLHFVGIVYDHAIVSNYLGIGHNIGSSDHYNAFYTIYFEFMNSGGYIGCFIFSSIMGGIIGNTYKCMRNKKSVRSIFIAAFTTFIMAMGTYNYTISGISALMIIICIILIRDDEVITYDT